MGRLKREHLEVAILVGTSLQVAQKLLSARGATGGSTHAGFLLTLTASAIFQEFGLDTKDLGSRYECKRAASQGTALGGLALPWLFAALFAALHSTNNDTAFAEFAFLGTSASSALILALLPLASESSRLEPPPSRSRKRDLQSRRHPSWQQLRERISSVQTRTLPLLLLAMSLATLPLLRRQKGSVALISQSGSGVNANALAVGIVMNATAGAGGVHMVLTHLPRCFTIGEALVVVQAAVLLAADVAVIVISLAAASFGAASLSSQTSKSRFSGLQTALGEREQISIFVELLIFATLCIAFVAIQLMWAISAFSEQREAVAKPAGAAQIESSHPENAADSSTPVPSWDSGRSKNVGKRGPGLEGVLLALLLTTSVGLAVRPAIWVLGFAALYLRRLAVLAYWAASLAFALPAMDWLSRRTRLPTIIVRKGYHLLALVLFGPVLYVEPELLSVSLAVACALLVVLEAARVGGVPYLGPRIHRFMTSFIDDRDSGLLLVSHFSLLVGMAAPVWLCISGRLDDSNGFRSRAAAFSGIAVLGVADSAASVLGRKYGRHRILGTSKTAEGTVGGIACNAVLWTVVSAICRNRSLWWRLCQASLVSCLLEASTTQLDNIFLPLHHLTWIL